MIQKPTESWGRESPAIATARNIAIDGKAAVVTGGRVLRGLVLCASGGLWLFVSLVAGASGNLPTLLGVGGLGLGAIFLGLRIMRGPRAADDGARAGASAGPGFAPAAAGPLNTIAYSRGKLLAHAGLGALAVLFAFWGVGHFGGVGQLFMILLIPVAAYMALGAVRRASGDLTALRWDERGLTVRTLFSQRDLAWSEVAGIGIKQVTTYALFGVLKTGSQRSLMVRVTRGGLFGGRVGVSSNLLDLGGRTLEGLVIELGAAQAGRNPPPSMASAAHLDAQQPSWGFVPEARAAPALRLAEPAAARFASQPPLFGSGSGRGFGRRGV